MSAPNPVPQPPILPPKPMRPSPADGEKVMWDLRDNVIRAIKALPGHFSSPIRVENIPLPDIHTLNTGLGGAIERETVDVLNSLRGIWDEDGRWSEYRFVRYSQQFPDVLLIKNHGKPPDDVALGIELKGWFALAKEGVPSLRFKTTPSACTVYDLVVVCPWYLDQVLGGRVVALPPWIESARYVALMRNYWWQYLRSQQETSGRKNTKPLDPERCKINPPDGAAPYPNSKQECNDSPAKDRGGNFGRIARIEWVENGKKVGLLTDFIEQTMGAELAGVAAEHWLAFIKALVDGTDAEKRRRRIQASLVNCSIEERAELGDALLENLLAQLDASLPPSPVPTKRRSRRGQARSKPRAGASQLPAVPTVVPSPATDAASTAPASADFTTPPEEPEGTLAAASDPEARA